MNMNSQKLRHNLDIPGWGHEGILDVLGKYAAGVSDNGNILELGGLFGRSTYTLGCNKKDSVALITIDVWPTMINHKFHDGRGGQKESDMIINRMSGDPLYIQGDDFYDLWKIFTKDVINHKGIKGLTLMPNDNFPIFDLIYHDAGHSFDDVYNDLIHWFPKLSDSGIIIVDDYDIEQFPGVVAGVDLFVKQHQNKFNTEMVTKRNILLRRQ